MENNSQSTRLDQRRSIDIITSAINDTRARMARSTGTHMLLWGYAVALTSLAAAAVTRYAFTPATPMIWLVVPVIGLGGTWLHDRRHPRSEYPRNRMLRVLWWTVGIIAAILATAVIPIYRFLHPAAALFGTGEAEPCVRVASYEAWFALTAAVMLIIPGHILHNCKTAGADALEN